MKLAIDPQRQVLCCHVAFCKLLRDLSEGLIKFTELPNYFVVGNLNPCIDVRVVDDPGLFIELDGFFDVAIHLLRLLLNVCDALRM